MEDTRISIHNYRDFSNSELASGLVQRKVSFAYDDQLDSSSEKEYGDALLVALKNTSADTILGIIICKGIDQLEIVRQDIPEFSSLDVVDKVLNVLQLVDSPTLSFEELGFHLDGEAKKPSANQKFGENHFKLSQQLSLAAIDSGRKYATAIGKSYLRDGDRATRAKLILSIPFIQLMLLEGDKHPTQLIAVLKRYLSETTALRRRSSIETLAKEVEWLGYQDDKSTVKMLRNVDWESLR